MVVHLWKQCRRLFERKPSARDDDVGPDEVLGERLLRFAHPNVQQRWMPRRVERVVVVDDRTINREVTFYLDFSEFVSLPSAGPTIFVPLMRLDRGAHAVTVATAYGDELNRPTLDVERSLVLEGLQAKWRRRGVPDDALQLFADAVQINLRQPPALARWGGSRMPPSPRTLILRCVSAAQLGPAETLVLYRDLLRWQRWYLLLVEIDTPDAAAPRRIVNLSYKEAIPRTRGLKSRLRPLALLGGITKLIFGTMSWAIRIPVNNAGGSSSSHVVLSAPPGFSVIDASLRIELAGAGGRVREYWLRDDDRLPSDAHVVTGPFPGMVVKKTELIASFYSHKTGFFLESWGSALVLWAIVQVFYNRLAAVGYFPRDARLDPNFAAALVLLLPAVVVTLVTQRDAHRIASRAFALPRFYLAVSAAGCTGAAALLALNVRGDIGKQYWTICVWACFAVAARFTVAGLVHAWRVSSIRNRAIAPWRFTHDQKAAERAGVGTMSGGRLR